MMAKIQGLGFGYIPDETKQHYLVRTSRRSKEKVRMYERLVWDIEKPQESDIDDMNLKVLRDKYKWALVKDEIQTEFNKTLRMHNTIVGRFKIGDVPVERLLGKEMIL